MTKLKPPAPLTTPDIDCRKLAGFRLDTERLLASELWALSTGEEFKAAVALWCRAWQQIPAASLPNDERVLAAFAGVSRDRWPSIREVALRGFILCSDGRLYHPTLAEDALRAHGKYQAYLTERAKDRDRLRNWREERRRNQSEAEPETDVKRVSRRVRNATETPSTGTGTGTGDRESAGPTAAAAAAAAPPPRASAASPPAAAAVEPGHRPPGGSGGKPATAAAAPRQRITGIDPEAVRREFDRSNAFGILAAFGIDPMARAAEWRRDLDGVQLGVLVVIFAWRRHFSDPIRQPSGWRKARVEWRALDRDSQEHIATELGPRYGVHFAPSEKTPPGNAS